MTVAGEMFDLFEKTYGAREGVIVASAPGRVNIMRARMIRWANDELEWKDFLKIIKANLLSDIISRIYTKS